MNKRNVLFAMLVLSALACTSFGSKAENNEPDDELYVIDYECDSMTTSGMVNWCVMMNGKETARVKALTATLTELVSARQALSNEVELWNKASLSAVSMNMMMTKLQYWFGGSYGAVARASVPLDISFIRRACLEDDIRCIKGQDTTTKSYISDSIQTSAMFAKIDSALTASDFSSIDQTMFNKNCGSPAEYNESHDSCRKAAAQLKTDILAWIKARHDVGNCLTDQAERNAYRYHTQKVINTLSDNISCDAM